MKVKVPIDIVPKLDNNNMHTHKSFKPYQSSTTTAAETISKVLLGDLTNVVFIVIFSPLWNNTVNPMSTQLISAALSTMRMFSLGAGGS